MKKLSVLLICLFSLFVTNAQQGKSEVTFTITGNKNLQLVIDGINYDLVSSSTFGNKTTVIISNLAAGLHSFRVSRTDPNSNRAVQVSGSINLRSRYDMLINVKADGSLELIETRNTGLADEQSPMNNTKFTALLRNARNLPSASAKRIYIGNAISNNSNFFSVSQAGQLIQLVTAESERLQLMKTVYPKITDPDNFYELYSLLRSTASRNEIEDFVYNNNETGGDKVAMSAADFNALYQEIRNKWPVSLQMTSLRNAFSNTSYFFSSHQASQLIQIVSAESNRLELAKLSYRSITDRNNFSLVYNVLSFQTSKDTLTAYINNYSDGSGNTSMSDAAFTSLYNQIRNQWPASAQMNSLRNAFSNTANYFSSYQASQLVSLVSAESNRLELAKLSYRSITDRSNFGMVFDLLSFQSSKDELTNYINNYSGGNGNNSMSDADFTSLFNQIRNQWPASAQMTSLRNAFNNTGNYFTSYQASELIRLVSTESNRLELAKLSYRSITDRSNFGMVSDLLSFQSSRDELTSYINNYSDGNGNNSMSDADFTTLYNQVRNQWPVSAQMNTLRNTFNNTGNYFTTYQASKLIEIVIVESNRLELAKLSYRSITDKYNFSQVFNLLAYQSSKDDLTAYINNFGSGGGTKTPMSESEFNTLYQNIQLQFLPGAKMSALTSAFNNTGYYFTCAQAKQLIVMVSLESNRLQLAKLSYRTITDRVNFTTVYDALNSQASRDELDAYVKAYTD